MLWTNRSLGALMGRPVTERLDEASGFQRDANSVVKATTGAKTHDSLCHMAANDQRLYV